MGSYESHSNHGRANLDSRPGAGITSAPDPVLGKQTVGKSVVKYFYNADDYEEYDDVHIDEEDLEAVGSLYQPVYRIDPKRSTVSHSGGNMRQSTGLNEKSVHTTTARSGISPFKQKPFTGGAVGGSSSSQAHKTGNYRRRGTLSGNSHAYDFDDDGVDPLYFGEEPITPEERSYLKQFRIQQQNLNKISEVLENLEKTSYL